MSKPVEPRKPLSARIKAGESLESIHGKETAEVMKRMHESDALSKAPVRSTPVVPNLATLANEIEALKARVAELETAFKALAGRL